MGTLNALDLMIIIILSIFVFRGFRNGLMKSIFSLFSLIITLFITKFIYPYLAKFLRETALFDFLKERIANSLDISQIVEQTLEGQSNLISNLPIPNFLEDLLLSNNNPVIYGMVDALGVEDYIASYIAALLINIISMFIVFIVVHIIIKIITGNLNIFNHIPIIKHFNRLGGAIVGFALGTVVIWIIFAIIAFFFITPPMSDFIVLIQNSKFANFFYEHNLILNMLQEINFYP